MLVDCFLYLWFRGLINLGEYSKGKATRTVRLRYTNRGAKEHQQYSKGEATTIRALAVHKLGR